MSWKYYQHSKLSAFPLKYFQVPPLFLLWTDIYDSGAIQDFSKNYLPPEKHNSFHFYFDAISMELYNHFVNFVFSFVDNKLLDFYNNLYDFIADNSRPPILKSQWDANRYKLSKLEDKMSKINDKFEKYCSDLLSTFKQQNPNFQEEIIDRVSSLILQLEPTSIEEVKGYVENLTEPYLLHNLSNSGTEDSVASKILKKGIQYYYELVHDIVDVNRIIRNQLPAQNTSSSGYISWTLPIPSITSFLAVCKDYWFSDSPWQRYQKDSKGYLHRKITEILPEISSSGKYFVNIFQPFLQTIKNMNIYMDSHSPPTASFIKNTDFYCKLESCKSLLVHFDLVIFRNAGNLELDRLVVNLSTSLGSGASGGFYLRFSPFSLPFSNPSFLFSPSLPSLRPFIAPSRFQLYFRDGTKKDQWP